MRKVGPLHPCGNLDQMSELIYFVEVLMEPVMKHLTLVLALIVTAQAQTHDFYPKQRPGEPCVPGYQEAGPEFCRRMNPSVPDAMPCYGTSPPPGFYKQGNICRPAVPGRRA